MIGDVSRARWMRGMVDSSVLPLPPPLPPPLPSFSFLSLLFPSSSPLSRARTARACAGGHMFHWYQLGSLFHRCATAASLARSWTSSLERACRGLDSHAGSMSLLLCGATWLSAGGPSVAGHWRLCLGRLPQGVPTGCSACVRMAPEAMPSGRWGAVRLGRWQLVLSCCPVLCLGLLSPLCL